MTDVKEGVRLFGIRPEMAIGHAVVASVFADYGVPCTITSGLDGTHMLGSLHYAGLALDYRLPSRYSTSPNINDKIIAEIRRRLAGEFDAILEGDHLHVEADPKKAVPAGGTYA